MRDFSMYVASPRQRKHKLTQLMTACGSAVIYGPGRGVHRAMSPLKKDTIH
jgi:hypothetical protein